MRQATRRSERAVLYSSLTALALVAGLGCDKMLAGSGDSDASVASSSALSRESHGVYFPIGSGSYHATQTCDDCHGGFDDFKQFTCQSCHAHAPDVATMRHTFITDFQNVSSACYACHPNGREAQITVADHSAKYFPIAAGAHAGLQCTDCHTWTTTSRPFTCQSCHTHAEDVTATAHASITGYRYDSNGCFGCHPGGGEAPIAASDHSSRFFPIQSGSHQNLSCASCHTDSTSSKVFVCTSCHTQSQSAGQHTKVSGYTWTEAACYGCHPQDQ